MFIYQPCLARNNTLLNITPVMGNIPETTDMAIKAQNVLIYTMTKINKHNKHKKPNKIKQIVFTTIILWP